MVPWKGRGWLASRATPTEIFGRRRSWHRALSLEAPRPIEIEPVHALKVLRLVGPPMVAQHLVWRPSVARVITINAFALERPAP